MNKFLYVADNDISMCIAKLGLFCILEREPLLAYIFNENIILLEEDEISIGYTNSAMRYLIKLYENERARKTLPETLIDMLSELVKYKSLFANVFCLGGYPPKVDARYLNCLSLKMSFNANNEPFTITLDNIARIEELRKFCNEGSKDDLLVAKIPIKFNISTQEAFILFSNINTTKLNLLHFSNFIDYKNMTIFQNKIQSIFGRYDSPNLEANFHGMLYCTRYLEYLIEQMKKGNIHPSEILRLSGAEILVMLAHFPIVANYFQEIINKIEKHHDRLSNIDKLQYYILLTLYKYYQEDLIISHNYCEKIDSFLTVARKLFLGQAKLLNYTPTSYESVTNLLLDKD